MIKYLGPLPSRGWTGSSHVTTQNLTTLIILVFVTWHFAAMTNGREGRRPNSKTSKFSSDKFSPPARASETLDSIDE